MTDRAETLHLAIKCAHFPPNSFSFVLLAQVTPRCHTASQRPSLFFFLWAVNEPVGETKECDLLVFVLPS